MVFMLVDFTKTWDATVEEAAKIVFDLMRDRHLTLATAESCTGGNIAHHITLLPGSSEFFLGGVVSYANSVKNGVLGVDMADIEKYGAVSQPVVEQMAEGVVLLVCIFAHFVYALDFTDIVPVVRNLDGVVLVLCRVEQGALVFGEVSGLPVGFYDVFFAFLHAESGQV
ncbi:MAG: CinA family protein, partial [Paludibacteraceae bacterium]|nr:CinA family protein [Paludibacteraceae bacterium]